MSGVSVRVRGSQARTDRAHCPCLLSGVRGVICPSLPREGGGHKGRWESSSLSLCDDQWLKPCDGPGATRGRMGGSGNEELPVKRSADALQAVLSACTAGAMLRQAAESAGVHVATVCRWQARDPRLRQALAGARAPGRERSRDAKPDRPRVRWRRDCPACRARVVVRTARGGRWFWRCGRWPLCPWASWRPRAPRDCPRCGSYRVWSHSRQSVVCDGCGLRTNRALTRDAEGAQNGASGPV
jgi:hypothetical protein